MAITGQLVGALAACLPSSRFVAESMMKTIPARPSPEQRAREAVRQAGRAADWARSAGTPRIKEPSQKKISPR